MPGDKYERDKAESLRKEFKITTGPDPSYTQAPPMKTYDMMDQVYHDIKKNYKKNYEEIMDTKVNTKVEIK